jgi:hypothetical protein
MTERLHFHIGLGKLGLGFVVPLFSGTSSIVGCHRELPADAPEAKKRLYDTLATNRFYERVNSETGERHTFALTGIVPYGAEGLLAAARKYGVPAIVTCAVGKGLVDVPSLLAPLIEAYRDRYASSPLLFIPFENARNAGQEVLAAVRTLLPAADGALLAVDTVVDQVCSELEADSDGCFVKAETASSLIVGISAGSDDSATKAALAEAGLAARLAQRTKFEYEVRKKAWIVNGLHYCIGVIVVERNLGHKTIAEALGNPDVADAALLYVKEAALALRLYAEEHRVLFDEDELLDSIDAVLTRMRTLPDDIGRILRPLMLLRNLVVSIQTGLEGAQTPVEFGDILRKWTERIVEPAELILGRHRELQEPLIAPRLSLFLLRWLSEYLTWLPARR